MSTSGAMGIDGTSALRASQGETRTPPVSFRIPSGPCGSSGASNQCPYGQSRAHRARGSAANSPATTPTARLRSHRKWRTGCDRLPTDSHQHLDRRIRSRKLMCAASLDEFSIASKPIGWADTARRIVAEAVSVALIFETHAATAAASEVLSRFRQGTAAWHRRPADALRPRETGAAGWRSASPGTCGWRPRSPRRRTSPAD